MASLVLGVVWLTGCDDNGRTASTGTNNNSNSTIAPVSIAGKTITHTITTATPPFSPAGGFVVQFGGTPGLTSGNFNSVGSGGVTNTTGTYTYVATSGNTATLVLQDSALGEVVENLNFQTSTSGTFSSSRSAGGTQAGSFTTD